MSNVLHEIAQLNALALLQLKHGDCQRARKTLIDALSCLHEGELREYDETFRSQNSSAAQCNNKAESVHKINQTNVSDTTNDKQLLQGQQVAQVSEVADSFRQMHVTHSLTDSEFMDKEGKDSLQDNRSNVFVAPCNIYDRAWQIPPGSEEPSQVAAAILFNLALIYHRVSCYANSLQEKAENLQNALRWYREAHNLLQDDTNLQSWSLFLLSILCFNMMHIYTLINDKPTVRLLIIELEHIRSHQCFDSMQHQFTNPWYIFHPDSPIDSDVTFLREGFWGLDMRM